MNHFTISIFYSVILYQTEWNMCALMKCIYVSDEIQVAFLNKYDRHWIYYSFTGIHEIIRLQHGLWSKNF